MQDQNQNKQIKYSSKISVESKKSNNSSCRSLERPSWSSKPVSLTKNRSMVQVMSLQSSRKSDLYEKILEQDVPVPINRQSMGGIFNSGCHFLTSNQFKPENTHVQRKSFEENTQINHTCLCYMNCEKEDCPCFTANTEMCIKGFCCIHCIEAKNQKLMHEATQEKKFCTCKKTKCNKKYCSCFAAGVKCGKQCSCEGCINCDRVSEHSMEAQDSECYIGEEQLNKMDMPEKMEFQAVEFRFSNA